MLVSADIGVTYGWGDGTPSDALPPGAPIIEIRHVAIGYREAAVDPGMDWGTIPSDPTDAPFLVVDANTRPYTYALDGFPIGGYAGETISRYTEDLGALEADANLLDRFTLSPFSAGPLHLAYLALRVTYGGGDPAWLRVLQRGDGLGAGAPPRAIQNDTEARSLRAGTAIP
jgi:hypothetical protein